MTDSDIVGTLVKTVNIGGTLVKTVDVGGMLIVQQDISGTLEISGVRIADIMVTLAATNGEQDISVSEAAGGTVVIVELPIEGGVTKGVLGTFKVHLVAKSHTLAPSSVDVALLDTDSPDSDFVFPSNGRAGPNTRARAITKPVSATEFALGADVETIIDRSFAARPTFRTKGTSGSLALAFRFNGGTDIVYTMRVQVDGKALAGAL